MLRNLETVLNNIETFQGQPEYIQRFIKSATSAEVHLTKEEFALFSDVTNQFYKLAQEHFAIAKELEVYRSAADTFLTAQTELPGL